MTDQNNWLGAHGETVVVSYNLFAVNNLGNSVQEPE